MDLDHSCYYERNKGKVSKLMLKMYFGSVSSIVSTILIIGFGILIWQVMERRATISKWGLLVLILFFMGLFMSMMSGMKDGMGTVTSIIPMKHWVMALLCILGGLAFLIGITAIIIRKQTFWQFNFYLLSAIIIVKILVTEGYRIYDYIKK